MTGKKCAAHNRSGTQCHNWALPGCSVCRYHGGASPQARAAAQRRLLEERTAVDVGKVRDRLRAEGVDVDAPIDVEAEFNRIIAEAITFKDILGGLVEQLRDLENVNRFESSELRAVVNAYERAQDRVARILTDFGKLGLSERRTKVQEAQAAALVAVVQAALQAATTDPEGIRRGQQVAARRLAELGAAGRG